MQWLRFQVLTTVFFYDKITDIRLLSARMIYKIESSYADYSQIKGIYQKKNEFIDEIIVVAKTEEIQFYDDFVELYGITKPFKVIEGGETRQISARNGIDAVNDKSKFNEP